MFLLIQQGEFVDRVNLGKFLNHRGLLGHGVEVGTHRGVYASQILDQWEGKQLCCIDPWSVLPGYEDQADILIRGCGGAPTRDEDFQECQRLLTKHHKDRFCMVRKTSMEAVDYFRDESLSFVYVDGDHRKDFVSADLHSWWPKISRGGILAGHDILNPGELGSVEIQQAVIEFATKHQTTIYLIVEMTSLPWSFYFIKE